MRKIISIFVYLIFIGSAVAQQFPAYQLFINVNGVPTAVTSTLTTGQIPTPPAILAKCVNAGMIVDCNFSGGGGNISLTTIGTSGASTLSGTTLNIPIYNSGSVTSVGPVGAVQVAGANGVFAQGTGDMNYQSVASTPLSASQGSLQVIANSTVDQNLAFFTSDGTPYWCAGPGYCSFGVFAEDYTYTLIQNPAKFVGAYGSASIRNIVAKFIAQADVNGQLPGAINQAGTGTSLLYSGWDSNHAFWSGVTMYMIPLMCYEDFLKTGSTTCYTTNVVAIKKAQAFSPINGTSHLPTNVVGASEWVPQSLFLEQSKFSGDVASASVLRAASDAVMAAMATAAADSTNATFFNTDFTNVTTSIQSLLIDPTSHMLWGATGQNKQIDVLTSGMAVWFSNFTGRNILTLAQQKAIGTFLHTNLATMTYNGYFANTVTTGGAVTLWTTVGIIPSGGGGSGYTSSGCPTGDYQQGYWSLVTGMNAYALSLTNPTDVPTLLATFRDASAGASGDPSWEYYNADLSHGGAGLCPGATTPNMESPQGAAWAAANIVGPTAVAATLGTTNKYGAIVTGAGAAGNYVNLCSIVTLSAGATCSGGVIAITTGTASITISTIPGTYTGLVIKNNEYSTSGGAANLLAQFNGDVGANYSYQQIHSSGTATPVAFAGASMTSAPIGAVGNTAGHGVFVIDIPFYAQTVLKSMNSSGGQAASALPTTDQYSVLWNSTAPITSITFTLSAGNFGTGFMSLYGTN